MRPTALPGDPRATAALALVALLALYAPTLRSYHALWSGEPYTHGYLVAAAALWLLWRERAHLRPSATGWWAPAAATAALSVVWLLAAVADAALVAQTALPLLGLGWAAMVFGPGAARRLAPIAGVLLLTAPFWSALITPLRLVTIQVTYAVLGVLGVPADIDGAVITIEHGAFRIEDACAGFNYFMAGLSIGAIYALGALRAPRARLAFVALACAMAVVGNWVRVASLIVIGHVTRMEARVIYDHGAYGWGIFFVGLLLLLPAARLVERWDRPEGTVTGPRETHGAPAKRDPGAAPEGERVRPQPVLRATGHVAVGPVVLLLVGALPTTRTAAALPTAPTELETVTAARPYAWRPAFSGADEHHTRAWASPDGTVLLDHLVYLDQEQGAELIGFTSRIAADSLVAAKRMLGPLGPRGSVVNEAVVGEDDGFVLVWYWYAVGGIETASALKAKLLEIPAFFQRRRGAELIALSTRCEPRSCTAASERLLRFLEAG